MGWTQRSTERRTAAQETIEAKFGREGTLQIGVARWLKSVEQRILTEPERPVSWRMQIHAGQPHMPSGDIAQWPNTVTVRGFLDARSAYFRIVAQDAGDMVSQGLDVLDNGPVVLAYAASYVELLKDLSTKAERESGTDQLGTIVSLRNALAVDTIRLVIKDYRGQIREAALVAPTHPLRALRQLAWAKLGAAWVREATKTANEHVTPTRDALLHGLSSINFPAMLPVSDGRVFTAVDNIHPVLAPLRSRGRGRPTRTARRRMRCTWGTGAIYRRRGHYRWCTCIAYRALLDPASVRADPSYQCIQPRTRQCARRGPGHFAAAGHVQGPTIRRTALRTRPERFRCRRGHRCATRRRWHISGRSVLSPNWNSYLSQAHCRRTRNGGISFRSVPVPVSPQHTVRCVPPEEMAADRPIRAETTIPLHGLVQEFTTRFHDDASGTWWRRQPRHGTPATIDGGEEESILLGELPALISSGTAAVARSTPDSAARPVIRLELAPAERALINEIHDASDWVFTIDRNLGIEFFDHGGRRDRPDYLIDYTPSTVPGHGHRLIITSRSLAELEAILRPVAQGLRPRYE